MTNTHSGRRPSRSERGIALVLSLFLMMAMSVVGASLMFLSQTETYSSMNYRLMSQARYGAEAGVQKTVNYLINSYTVPTTTGADLLSNFDTTKSPVLCIGAACPTPNAAVVLSATPTTQASNYPVAAVQTAFFNAVSNPGSLPSGSTTVAYAPYATLLSMQQIPVYGGGLQTIQTWQITSDGTINAGRTATVEVTATLESEKLPATMYAAFGTNGGCGALNFKGNNTLTNSYDSSNLALGTSASGGNVGTNGNLTEAGGATINGSLSTPRVGVGSCSSGNVSALTSSGGAAVSSGVVQLPQQVTLATPALPNPLPPTTAYNGNGQILLNGASVGNVTVNANSTLTLCAVGQTCTINVNSITLNGNGQIVIPVGATVILNVAGQSQTTPIDFTGGSTSNASLDPSHFQIQYAGTGTVKVNGGTAASEMLYAPNAAVELSGGNDFYGSIVGATVTDTGGAKLHYDRHLSKSFFTVGNAMMSTFSWKKY
jgi:Tfp pilus assembly protein PilX